MNPQADQTPGLRLPQPSFNVGQAPATPPQAGYQQPVQAMPSAPQPQQPSMPGSLQPMPSSPANPPQAAMPVPQVQDMPVVQNDDEDAVDQEWTNKAREIVEKNRTDPYLLSREISKIKSQYIKVRYNKDIKTLED